MKLHKDGKSSTYTYHFITETADAKPNSKGRNAVRICLNCGYMKHSRDDYYQGRCSFDGHKIDNIRNNDHCSHWSRPTDYYDRVYVKDVVEVFS